MAYITVANHSDFERSRVSVDEETGRACVWIVLGIGSMAIELGEVSALINALTEARAEAERQEGCAKKFIAKGVENAN